MEQTELRRAIEAILFAAGERFEISRLAAVLEDDDTGENPNVKLIQVPKEETHGTE